MHDMIIDYLLLVYPILFLLPLGLYFLIARPRLYKNLWPVYLFGGLMVLSVFAPIGRMSHWIFLIVWIFVTGGLLIVHTVVWLMAAFKKKTFRTGAIVTETSVIISGLIIGNSLAVIMALVFLVTVLRYNLDLALE